MRPRTRLPIRTPADRRGHRRLPLADRCRRGPWLGGASPTVMVAGTLSLLRMGNSPRWNDGSYAAGGRPFLPMLIERCLLHAAEDCLPSRSARLLFWGRRGGLTRPARGTPFHCATRWHSRAASELTRQGASTSRRSAPIDEALGAREGLSVRQVKQEGSE
jgi:hypothetical protein